MGYEQIEHTADVGLHVWAGGLEELFAEAALGLISVMGEASGPVDRAVHVQIEAPDAEALLVDWLSELLFLFEARDVVPAEMSVRLSREPWRLAGEVSGPRSSAFVQHGPAVKAVTYHGLRVEERPGRAEAWVYLDI